MTEPAQGPFAAVALTRRGAGLARRLVEAFPGTEALAPRRFAEEVEGVAGFDEPVAELLARLWPGVRGFFLVMAAGIAVRSIAPLLRDKTSDPAVVVLDPEGKFAVSLLSGHLGGANDLALAVAERLGAVPVVTTATDAAGAPAAEVWARSRGLVVEDRAGVVAVNAAWASGDPVGAWADPEHAPLLAELAPHLALRTTDESEAARFPGPLLAVSHRLVPGLRPALRLRPRCLCLGVGARRGADPETVERGVRAALEAAGLSALAAREVVSVDAKAGEPALHALAASLGVPFRTFPASELAAVPVPTPSERVSSEVGTPSVSEAAALLAAEGGLLLLPKVKGGTWTLAVACRPGGGPEAAVLEGPSGVPLRAAHDP